MGDTGSQLIGVLLAAFGIICFWNTPFDRYMQYETKQILITIIAFVLPIADTTTVTINRMRAGKSPFVGGKDHTTHHLSYMGFSDRKVAFTFIGISALSYLLVYLIMRTINWSIPYIILFSIYAAAVIGLLYSTTMRKKKK
jgi:UDP-GlcNAc:undecaprenyl-phosphate GlcNAc-1-phosphate transferase